jgi:hypothetical protein
MPNVRLAGNLSDNHWIPHVKMHTAAKGGGAGPAAIAFVL